MGHQGGGQSKNPLISGFDQQAFMEAISTATATISHASVVSATIA